MKTAELYKLRTQRKPLACAAALLLGVLAPSVVLLWYTPNDPAAYTEAWIAAFEVVSLMVAVVLGGWLLGTEYRQDTLKRLLTSEPRRLRVLATKGVVGAVALSVTLATAAGIGWVAARAVGSMNDVTVPWQGREVLAFGITALIAATVAYCLSAITRSDTFAMVGTVTLVMVVERLLGLIPTVGKYTIGSVIATVEEQLTGEPVQGLSTLSGGAATITLVAWLAVFVGSAGVLFATRDV